MEKSLSTWLILGNTEASPPQKLSSSGKWLFKIFHELKNDSLASNVCFSCGSCNMHKKPNIVALRQGCLTLFSDWAKTEVLVLLMGHWYWHVIFSRGGGGKSEPPSRFWVLVGHFLSVNGPLVARGTQFQHPCSKTSISHRVKWSEGAWHVCESGPQRALNGYYLWREKNLIYGADAINKTKRHK